MPIGRPIANLRVHVLDDELNAAAVGVRGEIYLGGVGLARGYVGRAALTAERFATGCDGNRERMYRTGDVGSRWPEGVVEYLGRSDHQVKLRGQRIELGDIETALNAHPLVRESVVMLRDQGRDDKRLTAYVVVRNSWEVAAQALTSGSEGREDWVRERETVDDTTDKDSTAETADPTLNTVGWVSSYTGKLIPEVEMREWADGVAARILALQPRRVLEIGCGTGRLLFRIAPHVESYWGTDISAQALDAVAAQRDKLGRKLDHVRLLRRAAHERHDLPSQGFDTIILNSVIQCFPSADYLADVLRGAAELLEPGGRIFLGDVRNSLLLPSFHVSVQLPRLSDGQSVAELLQAVDRRLIMDPELAVQPAFFHALKAQLPRLRGVQATPKRAAHDNEMTRFRYDVVLRLDRDDVPGAAVPRHSWADEGWTLDRLRQELATRRPERLVIVGVPNRRVCLDVATEARARAAAARSPVRDLRARLQDQPGGFDPNVFWALEKEHPYAVEVSWSGSMPDGSFDVVLRRNDSVEGPPASAELRLAPDRRPLRALATDPQRRTVARRLLADAREYLEARLPSYMVPSAFVFMDRIPLTSSGKADRKALPPPEERQELAQAFVAPQSEFEKRIAAIWQEVLGTAQVGVDDNFFDVGGNSLLLAKVHHRLELMLKREFPMVTLLNHSTVRKLAAHFAQAPVAAKMRVWAEAMQKRRQTGATPRGGGSPDDRLVAIIGMACRYPGAANPAELWKGLCAGVEARQEFSDVELLAAGADPVALCSPRYVKSGARVKDVDRFDARFFGYSPADAEILDPQHRVFLEVCWQALEDAGVDPLGLSVPVGVYGGSSFVVGRYLHRHLLRNRKIAGSGRDWELMSSNTPGTLATRVAYHLNLGGPAMTVQTACSTSLVATSEAYHALIDHRCDVALAGGVSLLDGRCGYLHEDGFILSPDGHCRPFDKSGSGTWPSEGVGVVVLRRLICVDEIDARMVHIIFAVHMGIRTD